MTKAKIITAAVLSLALYSFPLVGLVDRFTAETRTVVQSNLRPNPEKTFEPSLMGFGGMYPRETYQVTFDDGSTRSINYYWDEIYRRPEEGDRFNLGRVLGYFWGPVREE